MEGRGRGERVANAKGGKIKNARRHQVEPRRGKVRSAREEWPTAMKILTGTLSSWPGGSLFLLLFLSTSFSLSLSVFSKTIYRGHSGEATISEVICIPANIRGNCGETRTSGGYAIAITAG